MPKPLPLNRVIIDGVWYRPFDAAERDGTTYYADPPVPWATMRVFRTEEGARLVYRFEREDDRLIDRDTLLRQVRSARHAAGAGRLPAELEAEATGRLRAHLQLIDAEHVRAAACVKASLAATPESSGGGSDAGARQRCMRTLSGTGLARSLPSSDFRFTKPCGDCRHTMKIDIATLAEYAIVDQHGKMSVLGIFNTVGSPQFPFTFPRVFVCLRLECRPIEAGTQHSMAIRVQDADGTELAPQIGGNFMVPKAAVQGGPITVQMVFDLIGLVFKKAGQYSVEVAVDNSHQQSIPFIAVAAGPSGPS